MSIDHNAGFGNPVQRREDDMALKRVWTQVERRTSSRRRHRSVASILIALVVVGGASTGVMAYAEGESQPSGGLPLLRSHGVFGDPEFASSPREEVELGEVDAQAKSIGAIGLFRDGAAHVLVRVPHGAAQMGTSEQIGDFQVTYIDSRFTRDSLRATRQEVSTTTRSASSRTGSFTVDYDAETDAVIVRGELAPETIARLKLIQGVAVETGGEVVFQ